jgi:hypothetical protein
MKPMESDLVILRNRDRFRSFHCTFYHSIVCVQGGRCICLRTERTEAHRKGEYHLAERSIFLPPKAESDPLPRAVLEVPQVQQALKTRQLENLTALVEVQVFPGKE